MTVGEILHGRGTPMSAHELAVEWPLYFRIAGEIADRDAEAERNRPKSVRRGR